MQPRGAGRYGKRGILRTRHVLDTDLEPADRVVRHDALLEPLMMPRWSFAVLAYVFAALALLGIVLPGLPTTPFVLLAAWAASRGSRRMHDWLVSHPRLGPPLAHWRDERAIAPRAKLLAIGFLIVSWVILFWRGTPPLVLALLAALFLCVGTFVGTRARPRG